MGHPDYVHCKSCGGHKSVVGSLSWTRLCATCATERAAENLVGIGSHSGPAFQRWRRSVAASVLPPPIIAALDAAGIFGGPVDELPDAD